MRHRIVRRPAREVRPVAVFRVCQAEAVELPARDQIDHAAGRAQGWADADADVRAWVDTIVHTLHGVDDLVGVYLHGSLAMSSFSGPRATSTCSSS